MRTEEVFESITPRGPRCEEVKVSSDNSHSLSGIVVPGALRKAKMLRTDPQESPEIPFSSPPPRPRSVLTDRTAENAGNPLHRLPIFKTLLDHPLLSRTRDRLVDVAPRSYRKSTPSHPSERGILSGYARTLNYAIKR